MPNIAVRAELQTNPVADEVSALTAVIRPILQGLLYGVKNEIATQLGGRDHLKLMMLSRVYRRGDGDCGICYEYAVHDAIRRRENLVLERVYDAIRQCKVDGEAIQSILFGAEKSGAQQIIDTAADILTDESRLLTGVQAQPPKLKAYLNELAAAFRSQTARDALPSSISGLWKADLFIGCSDSDRWVGTTVKINPGHLEHAPGLRIGIVPANQGVSDSVRIDESKNLVICPLPYDGAFMELFYNGWNIVQQFFASDALLPSEARLPIPTHRQVCRQLASRREATVFEVIDALEPISQPHLLDTNVEQKNLEFTGSPGSDLVTTFIAPVSQSA